LVGLALVHFHAYRGIISFGGYLDLTWAEYLKGTEAV
jgi:hypothetical protein